MRDASANLWLALCASCAIHGVVAVALGCNAHFGVTRERTRTAELNMTLAGAAPSAALPAREETGMKIASPFFSAAADEDDIGGSLPTPLPPRFLGMEELDVAPELRGDLELAPPLAGALADSAHAVLVLFIDSAGWVDNIEVETSTLPPGYVETTMAAFRDAVFRPGERAGHPVNSRIRIDISVK